MIAGPIHSDLPPAETNLQEADQRQDRLKTGPGLREGLEIIGHYNSNTAGFSTGQKWGKVPKNGLRKGHFLVN